MIVLLEGHLSYEVPLISVFEQVLNSGLQGSTVLQLADPMTGARGDILINDSHVLVGAQMYEPKAMGYPALKTLCAFALADFRLVQPDAAKANRGDHSLNLEIAKVLPLIPNLPESPDLIESPLERVFNVQSGPAGPVEPNMARLDPGHETGLHEQYELPPTAKTEGWRALRQTSEQVQDVRSHRQDYQSMNDRLLEELPAIASRHARDNGADGAATRGAKIKYRASNPFKSPATFFLTIVSLLKLLIPRVVLPVLLIFGIYKGGTYLYEKYKTSPAAASVFQAQPSHTRPASTASVSAPPIKELFPRARPKAVPPPPIEPAASVSHAPAHARPAAAPKHEAPKRTAASHAAKPEVAAVKSIPANEPIPEYKGPSSATGGEVKHRHAYQTVPTE